MRTSLFISFSTFQQSNIRIDLKFTNIFNQYYRTTPSLRFHTWASIKISRKQAIVGFFSAIPSNNDIKLGFTTSKIPPSRKRSYKSKKASRQKSDKIVRHMCIKYS